MRHFFLKIIFSKVSVKKQNTKIQIPKLQFCLTTTIIQTQLLTKCFFQLLNVTQIGRLFAKKVVVLAETAMNIVNYPLLFSSQ